MKITRAEIYKSSIPLREPFVISLGLLERADNIVVRLHTDDGHAGFGECSPFPTIHGETMDTCFAAGSYLGRGLLGKNPLDMDACAGLMDSLLYGNSSIKSAFDMALHDIASQHAGLPLYRFLSGKPGKILVTDYTVSLGEAGKMAADARKIIQDGFVIVKVKVGGSREEDLERIRRIREAIGGEIPLRIDANQGWSPDDAILILKALASYNIQHCEEPIARWNYMELPRIRKNSPIPIMADESCCDHHDAARLIDLQACDLFNIKLGKSSGIVKARKIVQLAEAAGMKLQLGGFLESRMGFSAAAHLALTSDSIVHFDFDTPLMFSEDPVEGGITYQPGGIIHVPEVPGLGATMNEDYLSELEKVIVE